ncbi:hypothetical protein [uncultured Cellulomonas sp.]|uniref:hypothetical protein n=1 Tax=uncultured Cellulomonas sp. TaxID=189682 RepID=UPI002603744E|nr:hypothetical protein [uncultured Cellulomonas sp.]
MPAIAYTVAVLLLVVCLVSAALGRGSAAGDSAGRVLVTTLTGSLAVVTFAITAVTA